MKHYCKITKYKPWNFIHIPFGIDSIECTSRIISIFFFSKFDRILDNVCQILIGIYIYIHTSGQHWHWKYLVLYLSLIIHIIEVFAPS